MVNKMNIGKMAIRWVVIAVFASVILSLLGWLYTTVEAVSPIMGGIVAIIAVAVLLIVAMKVRPGQEFFLDLLPVLLIVSAVIGVIAQIWATSPFTFVVDWSLVGLALAFSAVIFADALAQKVLAKM